MKKIFTRSQSQGFTLMEILIALSIFAIVGVMIAFVLQQLTVTRQIFFEKSVALNEKSLFQIILQRQLSQCLPLSIKKNQHDVQNSTSTFRGSATQVSCEVASVDFRPSQNTSQLHTNLRMATIQFYWEKEHIIETLQFKNSDETLSQILLSGVREWSLQYFDGKQWQNSWPNANALEANSNTILLLPRAIKASIHFQNGLEWPIYFNVNTG